MTKSQKGVLRRPLHHVLLDLCVSIKKYWNNSEKIFTLSFFLFLVFYNNTFSQNPLEPIKIGFLVRETGDAAIQEAAQAAIDQANAKGGYNGQKFELVVKTCDGPWGITSKQAVALIFEDKTPIMVTAVDARNAHLIEQVVAKSHVVMLSTLSSDPTLSRAYVPWYFRIIPDDRQQAEAIARQIYVINKAKKVALISLDTYDGAKSAEAFLAEVDAKGYPIPDLFSYTNELEDLEKISGTAWDAVVLAGTLKDGTEMIKTNNAKTTFAFLNFFSFLKEQNFAENVQISLPLPTAYVYDGVSIAVESIIRFGPDPEAIRKGLKDFVYIGKTGKIRFDRHGNRVIE